jgi:hypothetical protein
VTIGWEEIGAGEATDNGEIIGSMDLRGGEISRWREDEGELGRGELGSCNAEETTLEIGRANSESGCAEETALGTDESCIKEDDVKLGIAGKGT